MPRISEATELTQIVEGFLIPGFDPTDPTNPDKHISLATVLARGTHGVANTGVTATETGTRYTRSTRLAINTTLPPIAGGAALGVGKLLYTFPAGAIIVESSWGSLAITQTQGNITADTPEVGLGTVIASGAVSVLGGTSTFENIIIGDTAAADCNGTPTVKQQIPTANVPLVIAAGGAHTVYCNVADTWASSGDAAALLTGSVILNWRWFG